MGSNPQVAQVEFITSVEFSRNFTTFSHKQSEKLVTQSEDKTKVYRGQSADLG